MSLGQTEQARDQSATWISTPLAVAAYALHMAKKSYSEEKKKGYFPNVMGTSS